MLKDKNELLQLSQQLNGLSLWQLAGLCGVTVPDSQRRAKGWAGQLIEQALGATAGSLPIADFPDIGVELKTIPLDVNGKPRESTYICVLPMRQQYQVSFEQSVVYQKLHCVLWVPIEATPAIPLAERRMRNGQY